MFLMLCPHGGDLTSLLVLVTNFPGTASDGKFKDFELLEWKVKESLPAVMITV